MSTRAADTRTYFNELSERIFDLLTMQEVLSVAVAGEQSHFVRINSGRIRQSGCVDDAVMTLQLFVGTRNAIHNLPLVMDEHLDYSRASAALETLRAVLSVSPHDPHQQTPSDNGESNASTKTATLDPSQALAVLLPAVDEDRFTGFYAAGPMFRGNNNSKGQRHWFETGSYVFDYSLVNDANRSVKRTSAGAEWNQEAFEKEIEQAKSEAEALNRPPVAVSPGRHRCYLAQAAAAELLEMLSWDGLSEAAIQQGRSALTGLTKERRFSPLFNLKENFGRGMVPRFNDDGEVASESIEVIRNGRLVQSLVNARSAKEYDIESNAANYAESFRAPEVEPGDLPTKSILAELGTGLYLSNLHYLNWSDKVNARVTGMTRFACFWVENGELAGPIEDLRFDDTLYGLLGDRLLGLSDNQTFVPNVGSYFRRGLGGTFTPGLLIDDVSFTL